MPSPTRIFFKLTMLLPRSGWNRHIGGSMVIIHNYGLSIQLESGCLCQCGFNRHSFHHLIINLRWRGLINLIMMEDLLHICSDRKNPEMWKWNAVFKILPCTSTQDKHAHNKIIARLSLKKFPKIFDNFPKSCTEY